MNKAVQGLYDIITNKIKSWSILQADIIAVFMFGSRARESEPGGRVG
jgi:hypothetical protein